VLEVGGAGVGDQFVVDVDALDSVGVDRVLYVQGGPEDAGVREQGVAVRLHGLIVMMTVVDLAALGNPDMATQVVDGLTTVELATDAAAERLVGEPAGGMDGSEQLAVFEHGLGERMLPGACVELAREERSRDVPILEAASDPAEVIPVLVDHIHPGRVSEKVPGLWPPVQVVAERTRTPQGYERDTGETGGRPVSGLVSGRWAGC